MKARSVVWITVIVIVCTCVQNSNCKKGVPPSDWIQQVDALFSNYTYATPGCSLGIFDHGDLLYGSGYGIANLEYIIPNDIDTVFRIASFSKQFTGMCIALLIMDGNLKLDDYLSDYFPEYLEQPPITIADLLHHTSGIQDYFNLLSSNDCVNWDACITVDYVISLGANNSLDFNPGTAWEYSNTNYVILGKLVEVVSGVPFSQFAQDRIFSVLFMKDTHVHDNITRMVPNRATGYTPDPTSVWGYALDDTTMVIVGDGGVFTTISDLLWWDSNFYDNQLGYGSDLIDLVYTPGTYNNGTVIIDDSGYNYSFGLEEGMYKGMPIVLHPGGYAGFETILIRIPEYVWSVAILCNDGPADPVATAFQIIDIFYQVQN